MFIIYNSDVLMITHIYQEISSKLLECLFKTVQDIVTPMINIICTHIMIRRLEQQHIAKYNV